MSHVRYFSGSLLLVGFVVGFEGGGLFNSDGVLHWLGLFFASSNWLPKDGWG